MYLRGYGEKLTPFNLSGESTRILRDDLPLPESRAKVTEEVTAFRFLSGTMVWLDIISSITAGKSPGLLSYYPSIITSNSQTKLEEIMGCKNWVMLQIGHISALYEQQTQTGLSGDVTNMESEQAMDDIMRQIWYGLTIRVSEGLKLLGHHPLYSLTSYQIQIHVRSSHRYLLTWHRFTFMWSLMAFKS
jgi:hypothetical protein